MSFINWGSESPEQIAIRRRMEEQVIYEQAARMTQARQRAGNAQAGVGGGSSLNASGWIDTALANLNSRYAEITDLVPNIYYFWDDAEYDRRAIGDGGDDMYDGANIMNTNLTESWDNIKENGVFRESRAESSILYTHTQSEEAEDFPDQYTNPPMDGAVAIGNLYFGTGSKYFTNMYPGLFIMVADNISISEFNISGNVGSDGDGIGAGYVDSVIPGWTLFYKTNTDEDLNGDPSINQMILVPGSSSGIDHEYDTDSLYDDHRISGISDRSRIVYAVVARTGEEDVLSESDAILVSQKILEIIL